MAITYNFVNEDAIDQGADWFANFIYNQPAKITNITPISGTLEIDAVNGFTVGQTISISGVLPSQFNLENQVVVTATNNSFVINAPVTGIYISGGLAYAPVNLSGYTAAMQLRSLPSSPDAELTLTTENGGITIADPLSGVIALHATSAQTTAIDTGYYYYDLEIYLAGIVTRIAQGQILVSAEVTR